MRMGEEENRSYYSSHYYRQVDAVVTNEDVEEDDDNDETSTMTQCAQIKRNRRTGFFLSVLVVAAVTFFVAFVSLGEYKWNIVVSSSPIEQETLLQQHQQEYDEEEQQRRNLLSQNASQKTIKVFQPHPSIFGQPLMELNVATMIDTSTSTSELKMEHILMTMDEQRSYLLKYGSHCYGGSHHDKDDEDETSATTTNMMLEQWGAFATMGLTTFQIELWKYCALYVEGGLFLEAEALLLQPLRQVLGSNNVVVVSSVYPKTLYGGWMYVTQPKLESIRYMLNVLVETDASFLSTHPLYVAEQSYKVAVSSSQYDLWNQSCFMDPLPVQQQPSLNNAGGEFLSGSTTSFGDPIQPSTSQVLGPIGSQVYVPKYHRLLEHCPRPGDYCCSIQKSTSGSGISIPVLMSRHSMVPFRVIPPLDDLAKPYLYHYNHQQQTQTNQYTKADVDNLPYMSTVREVIYKKPKNYPSTPNFYDILHSNDCVPSNKDCSDCLRNKKGSTCKKCEDQCPCFCKALCHTDVPKKFLTKQMVVHPPMFSREVDRIVPRIIHQTWFEPVTAKAYPNMSRLIESWKQSGWEYRFYDDAAIESFLKIHFPSEILQAYNALIPGAFKADLFRYCVLLIYGGIYADMDVLLESNLEVSVPSDVGFMTPVDEPGKAVDKRMCLWNGLIAVAPAHPFMAQTIQNVVNGIRNRYTSVDSDHRLCDSSDKPELSVSHAWDTLFTAGPCIMGQSINEVLGRHQQTSYEPGIFAPSGYEVQMMEGSGTTKDDHGKRKSSKTVPVQLPGRSIILSQNKEDMGAHRFTLLESNLLVAATDMPDYDDRQYTPKADSTEEEQEQEEDDNKKDDADSDDDEDTNTKAAAAGGGGAHYSETHVKIGVYGLKGLYKDTFESVNADISIVIKN